MRRLPSLRRLIALPGAVVPVPALFVLWAYHNGGYDTDTWYWGALVILALLTYALLTVAPEAQPWRRSRPLRCAVAALALYTAFSYLSTAWAQSPGDALQGSNRALLYLLVFGLFCTVPWTAAGVRNLLVAIALGIGGIALLTLLRLADGTHALSMFAASRLVSPTGYYNANAALYTSTALLAIVLSAQRTLDLMLRAALAATGCACLQLALLIESRGWLFTLPFVLITCLAISRDRIRLSLWALVPSVGALAMLPRLLHVYSSFTGGENPVPAFREVGRWGLVVTAAMFVGTLLIAASEPRLALPPLRPRPRRLVGTLMVSGAVAVALAGGMIATHGRPGHYLSRQWHGFTSLKVSSGTSSHFAQLGSGRLDFWRVSLKAFAAHPLGGLGQDNFADYYVTRRRTEEEPSWTHSLEMRLLAHTGLVGTLLFLVFLAGAGAGALRARRGADAGAVAGAALLPATVWLIHGSVDWFWEIPALSAPALAGLAAAASLSRVGPPVVRPHWLAPIAPRLGAVLLLVLATLALGLPYLSVREVSSASDEQGTHPLAALHDLQVAADLNPLSVDPARLAGAIALRNGLPNVAQARFLEATRREPGGWFGWFGAGLAASTLGDTATARGDLMIAARINAHQPAIREALARVGGDRPLTPAQALSLLVVVY